MSFHDNQPTTWKSTYLHDQAIDLSLLHNSLLLLLFTTYWILPRRSSYHRRLKLGSVWRKYKPTLWGLIYRQCQDITRMNTDSTYI